MGRRSLATPCEETGRGLATTTPSRPRACSEGAPYPDRNWLIRAIGLRLFVAKQTITMIFLVERTSDGWSVGDHFEGASFHTGRIDCPETGRLSFHRLRGDPQRQY